MNKRPYPLSLLLFFCSAVVVSLLCPGWGRLPASAHESAGGGRPLLVVGGDFHYPPYEYLDDTGEPAGFNVDLTRALARVLGFDVRIELDEWSRVRERLERGEIDAVQGMFFSPEREPHMDFSVPHGVVEHRAFHRKGEPAPESIDDLRNKRLVVMRGDIMHDYAHLKGLSQHLFVVETQAEALRQLAAGEHDYALVAELPGLYWLDELGLESIEPAGPRLRPARLCYAVPEGRTELAAALSQGLAILRESGELAAIQETWFAPLDGGGLPPTLLGYLAAAGGAVLVLLVAAGFWLVALRSTVARRTREIRREMDAREELYRGLFERSGLPQLLMIPETGAIHRANPAAARYYGYDMAALERMRIFDLSQLSRERIEGYMQRLAVDGTGVFECVHRLADGRRRDVEVHAAFVLLEQSRRVCLTVVDMTERKRQQELERDMERMVRHDLRSPIVQAVDLASLLESDERFDDEEREMLAGVARSGRMALSLLAAQRDLMRLERGSVGTGGEVAVLGRAVDAALDAAVSAAKKNVVAVTRKVSSEAHEARIACEGHFLYVMFANLLQNAVEAAGQGGEIELRADMAEGGVEVRIANPGEVPPEVRETLFEKYVTSGKHDGTGLGAYGARLVAQGCGGSIALDDSVPGRTTIVVRLPVVSKAPAA